MLYKTAILVFFYLFPYFSFATWLDFEELQAGDTFNYKAYQFEEFQIKASKYFNNQTVTYYGFLLQANVGDSNYGENFLAVDTGSRFYQPGVEISHSEQQAFDLNYIEVGRVYEQDGYFIVTFIALDASDNIITQQTFQIVYGLAALDINRDFRNMHRLLINAVYISSIDDSVARFALDNIDLTLSQY